MAQRPAYSPERVERLASFERRPVRLGAILKRTLGRGSSAARALGPNGVFFPAGCTVARKPASCGVGFSAANRE